MDLSMGYEMGSTEVGAKKERRGRPPISRDAVLQGAMRAFGERGYAQTRIDDILEAAEISRPTFHNFFRDKDEAFDALSESCFTELISRIGRELAHSGSRSEALERTIGAYVEWRASLGLFSHSLDSQAKQPGTRAALDRRRFVDTCITLLRANVPRARQRGISDRVFVGLVAAFEQIGADLSEQGRYAPEDLEDCKSSTLRIFVNTLGTAEDEAVEATRPVSERWKPTIDSD